MLACGCTVSAPDNAAQGNLHLPLTYENWTAKRYTTSDGLNVCAVSSGYNGLIVTVGQMKNGQDAVVASNRMMRPGAVLTVMIGGKRFEAYDTYFTPQIGRVLVETMRSGSGKAYLEWSENSGPASRERIHVQNIIKLDEFGAKLKECERDLR